MLEFLHVFRHVAAHYGIITNHKKIIMLICYISLSFNILWN